MPHSVRDRVFLRYLGHPTFHERIALAHISDDVDVIATPEFDIYAENLNAETNPDINAARPVVGGARRPPGVPADRAHRFRALGARELERLLTEGEAVAVEKRRAAGVIPEGDRPAAQDRLGWRALERCGPYDTGDVVPLAENSLIGVERAITTVGGTEIDLARSLDGETREEFLSRFALVKESDA